MSTSVETPQNTPPQSSALLDSQRQQSVGDYISGYLRRIRAGDLGILPIIIGLIAIGVIFQSQNSNFLTPVNLVNLIVQMAGTVMIAYGIVFVLLLGEIDLSVAFVSAVGGASLTLILRDTELPWYVAMAMALAITTGIGLLQGFLITFFSLPSLIVTLAGFLVWSGAVLIMVGGAGTIIISERAITNITSTFLSPVMGWAVAVVFVGGYAAMLALRYRSRARQGLANSPLMVIAGQVIGLAFIALVIVSIANQDRGVPFVGVLLLVMMIALTYLAESTQFGRFVYAIGGNEEAARRAGIRVNRIKILVFGIAGFMAGLGGIILAARLRSVATNAGGGNLLLNIIAAAVIGGTSLFGGQGRVSSALLGGLIIVGIENGLGLLNVTSGEKFIITGIVLLIAVIVDSFSRRNQKRSGLA